MNLDIKLLDVTLRDGGHCCNFNFKDDVLVGILKSLNAAAIDYVEIGYRNGYLNQLKAIGAAGLCNKNYVLLCKEYLTNSKMSVMCRCALIVENDIKELKLCGVALIRLCVSYGEHYNIKQVIKWCQFYNLEISVNFTHVSQYKAKELISVMKFMSDYNVDMVYFADSNGSLLPPEVEKIFKKYKKYDDLTLGFHGHDNLGLAQANTLQAMQSGAVMIDASLAGLGKGGGNLVLEKFVAFLYANNNFNYDLEMLVKAKSYIDYISICDASEFILSEFIRGIDDLSTQQVKQRLSKFPFETNSLNKILRH